MQKNGVFRRLPWCLIELIKLKHAKISDNWSTSLAWHILVITFFNKMIYFCKVVTLLKCAVIVFLSNFAEFVISVLRRAKTRSRDLEEICRPSAVCLRWRENCQTVADAKGHDSSKHCQEYEKKHVRGQMFWLAIEEIRRTLSYHAVFALVLCFTFSRALGWPVTCFPRAWHWLVYMFSRASYWLVTCFLVLHTDWLHIFFRALHWLVTRFPALGTD